MTPEERTKIIENYAYRFVNDLDSMDWKERDRLIDNYACRIVNDMDSKDLCRIVAEYIINDFENETDEYVITTIKDNYPDLFDE